MPSANRMRGFTLFELLVVIILMAVAVGVVSFSVQQGLHSAAERRVMGQMVEALRAARVQAIVTGQPARTHFDLAERKFQGPGEPARALPTDLNVRLNTAQELGSSFEFYPDGGASGGSVLLARGGRHWRIDIGWLTGNVQFRTLQ